MQHTERERGVALVAVEEVLGVEEHPLALGNEPRNRVAHHRGSFFERRSKRLGHVVVPRLADDADHVGRRRGEVQQCGVVGGGAARPPGRTESNERRRLQLQLALGGPTEELVILRVGARPSTFDVRDAEVVELLGNPQLVVDGERQPLALAAVAERRVVDVDTCWYGGLRH
jgi:hypothetical protein